jgi:sugar O-acyltransferase (sialic acid O-acetyltransferase NeuD family)
MRYPELRYLILIGVGLLEAFIYGAGGLAREIHSLVKAGCLTGATEVYCFVDEEFESALHASDVKTVSKEHVLNLKSKQILLGVGNRQARMNFVSDNWARSASWPNVIHSNASIGSENLLGKGLVALSGVSITVGCEIGNFALFNPNASISHDCVIGDFVSVGPGVNLAGRVKVGDCVDIGTGAIVLPGIQIGSNAVIGAGAVVTKDVRSGDTVVGNPAKVV